MPPATRPLPHPLAVVLVVSSSAAVLVLEILAGRLLAPYVGVSLETYTGIIGTVLAGISLGAWAGGTLADRHDPRRLLPVLFVAAGGLALLTIPAVRVVGGNGGPGAPGSGLEILLLAAIGFLPAATVLSAVPPAVVKLQLRHLDRAGSTVGELSAWSTAGAIAATFATGFVLVRWAAVTTLIVAVGGLLAAGGVALAVAARAGRSPQGGAATGADAAVAGEQGPERPGEAAGAFTAALLLVALGITGVATVEGPCQTETAYYCASVRVDDEHPSRRTLVLDDLRHSTVDLDDPTYLGFWYVRRLAGAIEAEAPGGAIDVVHVGGGGLTLPRYLRATRPGSRQTVLEIDGRLVQLVEDRLGFAPGPDVRIEVGDGRLGVRALPDASADVVVGDAFGSRAVPWHLATREFQADVRRVLRPGGLYVANIIDGPDQRFLRAEAATLATVFEHVEVVLGPQAIVRQRGNAVILASDAPLDAAFIDDALPHPSEGGRRVTDLAAYVGGAEVLRDDHAPVDQLLSGSG